MSRILTCVLGAALAGTVARMARGTRTARHSNGKIVYTVVHRNGAERMGEHMNASDTGPWRLQLDSLQRELETVTRQVELDTEMARQESMVQSRIASIGTLGEESTPWSEAGGPQGLSDRLDEIAAENQPILDSLHWLIAEARYVLSGETG